MASEDGGWTKAPLDMLAHAHRHLLEGSESALRYALLGFDQAVEGSIAAFVRIGPGLADTSDLAAQARRTRSNFWHKINFLDAVVRRARARLAIEPDEITRIHDVRNDLQHDGRWIVPYPADVEQGRRAAVSVFGILAGQDVSADFPPVYPYAAWDLAEVSPRVFASPAWMAAADMTDVEDATEAERRRLAPMLYEIAKTEDPDRGGIHYTRLTRLLEQANIGIRGANATRTVYSALNNAHDLFDRPAPGIYAWREPDGRDIHTGLTGKPLADVIYAFCRESDPERRALHYNHDIKVGLHRWGVAIRGADVGKTIRNALRDDPRFARDRGRYVWLP